MKPLYGDANDIRERAQRGEELARYAAQHAESTTKPIAESGWSKEFPQGAGTYWLRSICNPSNAVVVVILGEQIRFTSGDSEKFSPKAGYEFLGPISPSDFEQLIQLRKASENLLNALVKAVVYAPNVKQAANALREALGHKGEQS